MGQITPQKSKKPQRYKIRLITETHIPGHKVAWTMKNNTAQISGRDYPV